MNSNAAMFDNLPKTQLPWEEEKRLILLGQQNPPDQDARLRIIATVYPFIRKTAMRYARLAKTDVETTAEEYEQEAIVYLLKRFNDFDVSRGVRYFKLVATWIAHAIQRFHFYKAPVARYKTPANGQLKLAKAVGDNTETLSELYREEPTPAEAAEEEEWRQRVRELIEEMAASLKSPKQRVVFRKMLQLPSHQAVGDAIGSTRQNIDYFADRILQNLILWVLETDSQAAYEVLQTSSQGLVFRFMASKPSMAAIAKLSKLIKERNLHVQCQFGKRSG